uniref:Cornifelin n=1 Tax=Sphenodon punctatus TaxID=8508 RepID=A0A8D0G1G5_SPHPU
MSQSVVTQQPTSSNMQPTGDWSSGRFDCFSDCGICLLGTFCPLLMTCYVAKQYGENCCLGLVGGMTALRTHMRLSYGIQGTICKDALSMCFCTPCELCRMAREIKIHS